MTPHNNPVPEGILFQDYEAFHRRDWKVQWWARIVFALVLLAAVAGVFGGGPLARVSASSGELRLDYDRFIREKSRLVLHLSPGGSAAHVRIDGLMDPDDELRTRPQPREEHADGSSRRLTFDAEPGTPLVILIEWKPSHPGLREGAVETDGGRLEIWSLIYP